MSDFTNVSCISSINNKPITLNELQMALKSLKNESCSSFDRIINEMLKQSTTVLLQCICKLFIIIINSGKYPFNWRENILKPLYKKGNETNLSNHRGIAISSCLSKRFARVLYNRIEIHVNKNWRAGYLRNFLKWVLTEKCSRFWKICIPR